MIEGILEAVTALALLVTKALPDDELKRERFKLRHPRYYQRIYQHILNTGARQLKRMGVTGEDANVIAAYTRGIKMDKDFEILLTQKLTQ